MSDYNIFYGKKLPSTLKKEELLQYFYQYRQGNQKAKEIIITHNIRLVIEVVNRSFSNTMHDKEDLVSIGTIGLIKAVDTFDETKNKKFSTYAGRCIQNEILMFLRKRINVEPTESLDEIITNDQGKDIRIMDTIKDETPSIEDQISQKIEDKLTVSLIREVLLLLPEKEREVVMLYFGFYDGKIYNQAEIAQKFGLSRSYISRIVNRGITRMKEILIAKGISNWEELGDYGKLLQAPSSSIPKKVSVAKPQNIVKQTESKPIEPIKENYEDIDIKQLFMNLNITKSLELFTEEEIIIITLIMIRPTFSIKELSNFLDIDIKELIEIIKNILLKYQNNINEYINKITQRENIQTLILTKKQ